MADDWDPWKVRLKEKKWACYSVDAMVPPLVGRKVGKSDNGSVKQSAHPTER